MGAVRNNQYPRPRLAEMIAGELRNRIVAGEYADGDLLPKQEDLLEQFGVSLPSIREALRVLETEGLVTVQRGNVGGAVVHAPHAGKVAYMLGLILQSRAVPIRDVVDALARLDPACAAKCAERADRGRTVVPLLRANITECREALDDSTTFAHLARVFHEQVVNNCGNETMILVVGTLESLWAAHVDWLSGRRRGAQLYTSTRPARQAGLADHLELVELIAAGDAEGASAAAHQHLVGRQGLDYPFSLDAIVAADTVRDRREE
jgi:GntR family transcriptional regulator, transcriptional repressor for pyruvate dehydrogenase complex